MHKSTAKHNPSANESTHTHTHTPAEMHSHNKWIFIHARAGIRSWEMNAHFTFSTQVPLITYRIHSNIKWCNFVFSVFLFLLLGCGGFRIWHFIFYFFFFDLIEQCLALEIYMCRLVLLSPKMARSYSFSDFSMQWFCKFTDDHRHSQIQTGWSIRQISRFSDEIRLWLAIRLT